MERSTKASEEAMLRDLTWLGLDWDEGNDLGDKHFGYFSVLEFAKDRNV